MLNIALLGASGRMGQAIRSLVEHDPDYDMRIASLWSRRGEPSLSAALAAADVAIDFSHPAATAEIAAAVAQAGVPLVSGVTGLGAQEQAALDQLASRVAVLHDGNMSVAVQLMAALSARIASFLPDYDIEISETHHRFKRDAPSGTALKLGHSVAAARGLNLDSAARHSRQGQTGVRDPGEIGFAVRRGGGVIGEHSVGFFGPFDQIEIRHSAQDRRLFADGALRAARWLITQKPGKYTVGSLLPAL